MGQATSQTIRMRADEISRSALRDANLNSEPQAWARAATQFELGLVKGGALVDVSNLASVTLEAARYDNRDSARLLSKTLALAALDNTLNEDSWADGTKAHALFRFTSAEMNLLTTGLIKRELWLVVSALTLDGDPIVFGTGKLTINDPGTFFTESTPPANPGAYLTIDQGDARYGVPAGTGLSSVGTGGAGSLEAMPTLDFTPPVVRTFYHVAADEVENWVLVASTAPTGPGTQRPNDFNAVSNAKVWFRK